MSLNERSPLQNHFSAVFGPTPNTLVNSWQETSWNARLTWFSGRDSAFSPSKHFSTLSLTTCHDFCPERDCRPGEGPRPGLTRTSPLPGAVDKVLAVPSLPLGGGTGPPVPGATDNRGGVSSVRSDRVVPERGSAHVKGVSGLRRCRQPT
ncbi:hypothetical protein NQZ68_012531 [Dissostichus eleginoides]|nr:hypothetical protein NQZ68_012531 [Dissostichus eleginoides]